MLIELTEKPPSVISVLVFLLLIAFGVRFTVLATSIPVESAVGVTVGDWGKYIPKVTFVTDNPEITELPPNLAEMNNTEWVKNVVMNISDTKITFERIVHYKDGNETSNVEYVDVSTGESSPNGTLMFIPSNLGKNDLVHVSHTEHYSINETIHRTYAGQTRDVNHLNVSTILYGHEITDITVNYYWDKETGILCDRPGRLMIYDGVYTTIFVMSEEIVETNVWLGAPDTKPPVAEAGQDHTVTEGTSVTFNASGSSDNVGIVSYEWDFGDGKTGTGGITTHTYTRSGSYIVTLTVRDAAGNLNIDKMTVNVKGASLSPMVIISIMAVLALICLFIWMWTRRRRKH